MIKNKKGTTLEMIIIIAVCFCAIVGFIFAAQAWKNIKPNLPIVNGSSVISDTDNTVNNFDSMFVGLYIGLNIIAIILAFLNRVSPVFAALGLILFIVTTFVGVIFSNTYDSIISSPDITIDNQFTMTTFIWQHIVLMSSVFLALLIFALYAGSRL